MQKVIEQFNLNIERIKTLHSLYLTFKNQVTNLIDVSDILRAEIVLLVSSVDFYVHEIVRVGMLEVFTGNRIETPSFQNYNISLKSIREAILEPENSSWLEREIIQRHSWKSFQQADKINEALKLITINDFWNKAASILRLDIPSLKSKLNLIVDRRNKIAHEADMDPSYPGSRWPIDENIVYDAIEFVEKLVNAMHISISENQN